MPELLSPRIDAISFRQLRLFESVGRLCSVRRGSEECNLSQPAVTQSLAKLEQMIGVELFERRPSGSYLTPLGRILYSRVVRMLKQMVTALFELEVPGGQVGAEAIVHRLTRSQVRSLVAIIEHGTFAAAAAALQITEGSLQRAARDLECNLRKNILFRSADGVIVTPAGIACGRRMSLALQEIDWAINEIDVARDIGESRIVIGALPFGGSVLLASMLDEFLATQSKVDVRIATESTSEMMQLLRDGKVDLVIGLTQETVGDDLVSQTLAETPYEVVARRGHPLTGQSHVNHEDLIKYDWVVGMPNSNRRNCFDRLFIDGPKPRTPIATSALLFIRHLLAGSNRLTLMTSYELQHETMLVRVPIDVPLPCPTIGITTRADWLPTALHRDFINLIKSRVNTRSIMGVTRTAA
ncbi:LysR family transcriptional regulator [Nitrospirillum iridis]|uniref:DNA-binding transcriptional LysR family regulator n=1 Tax=Nitrospirillum iridis TaxID=765888 RepID=A0A7X0B5A1_9PROT|nr:LysR family transcriptional regulator [Nitrospirillum iridis]MBB6255251.1 DNA-binding transcriptional LysR family regulator [Nitrospirillum iridis]